MRKSKEELRAFWHLELTESAAEVEEGRLFCATFVGPPRPRRKSPIELALEWHIAEDEKLRAKVRAEVLRELQDASSERARQRSYLRRLAEYADHERALQLARAMREPHRIDIAIKIADLFEREGRPYQVRTVDRWLSRPEWKRPAARAPG